MFTSTPTSFFFFFNDTATTEIYTLSLHDALPISRNRSRATAARLRVPGNHRADHAPDLACDRLDRSEEHTSELQSRPHLVCRLLLEKKKKQMQPSKIALSGHGASRKPLGLLDLHS